MGDHSEMKKLAMQHGNIRPRLDLEELYQGIPDDSVNLTFKDLANVQHSSDNNKRNTNQHILETTTITNSTNTNNNSPKKVLSSPSPMVKLPSLDFSKGLQASSKHNHHHHDFSYGGFGGGDSSSSSWCHHFGHRVEDKGHNNHDDRFSHRMSEYSMGGFDGGMMSGVSVAASTGKGGSAGRIRRPGIPHSKICTVCSTYIYLFRTRCLVCGRVYCRQCLEIGMGEMIEGRKCIECLGLRFSQRYIERAGVIGCCSWRYPSSLKQTEIKWAEKGPRRSGENRGYSHHHSNHDMMSSSTPRTPRTPRSPMHVASNEPSFVMSATYSSFSPHHHLPL